MVNGQKKHKEISWGNNDVSNSNSEKKNRSENRKNQVSRII